MDSIGFMRGGVGREWRGEVVAHLSVVEGEGNMAGTVVSWWWPPVLAGGGRLAGIFCSVRMFVRV